MVLTLHERQRTGVVLTPLDNTRFYSDFSLIWQKKMTY